MRIALAQLNPVVGDLAGNAKRVRAARERAAKVKADVVLTSELVLTGYPPEDLVLRTAFMDAVEAAVQELAGLTKERGPALIVGTPWRQDGRLYNAALVLDEGRIVATRLKHDLPNYGVFDEVRVFAAAPPQGPVNLRGRRLGIMVCEDMWFSDVAETLQESGAEALLVLNGSPFEDRKGDARLSHAVARVAETALPLAYVNQVGGQDELVFDGASFALNADRSLACRMASFAEDMQVLTLADGCWQGGTQTPMPGHEEAVYRALCLGLGDYVRKNGFPGVLLGLSGGIDSALAAAIATDALGPEKLWCVMMPSSYTARASLEDAAGVAAMLGCRLDEIGIGPAMEAFAGMLKSGFAALPPNEAEENIQSRIRGLALMALSNKHGPMVVATGNKSEMSVGYATLYGDMCGGYAVLKDVYKTAVVALSRWRNQGRVSGLLGPQGPVMPERVISKPPTAELKPDQKDEDSLPPYAVLDELLAGYVERREDPQSAINRGADPETVWRVYRLLNRAEYKRRQAPPGVKLTALAFGRDRRHPITNAWSGT